MLLTQVEVVNVLLGLYNSHTSDDVPDLKGAVRLNGSPSLPDGRVHRQHPADVSDMEAQHLRDAEEFELTGLIDEDSHDDVDSPQNHKERRTGQEI